MTFAGQLRKIAEHVGLIVDGFPAGDPEALPTIMDLLQKYAEILLPWATATSKKMLSEINARDERAWFEHSNEMSRALRQEIRSAPTGTVMQQLLSEQVGLIQSLPLEAAQRVHKLTLEGIEDGTRAKDIAAEIMRTSDVTQSRANLIARTEVSRTATLLTQARAEHIGSDGYIWRTSHDSDVRKDHQKLEGKFFKWDDPPVADSRSGERAHPGCIYNCRCYAEPVIPEI